MWVAGRSVSRLFVVLFVPFALAALGVAAYAIDSARHDGRVARNVHLDDRPIGGRALAEGERVRIVYGAGPAGARADRYAERGSRFWVAVDGNADGVRRVLMAV